MAKHKVVRGTARGKAPGVQKPKSKDPTPDPTPAAEPQPTEIDQARALREKKLEQYKHERFADEYIDNGGNATQAYLKVYKCDPESANANAHRLMVNDGIRALIDHTRAEQKLALGMSREKLLRIQVAMAVTTIDEVVEVGRNHLDEASYAGLGDKRYAIKSAEPGQFGTKLHLNDRQAAVNELWTKLGIKTQPDSGRGESTTRSLLKKLGIVGDEPGGTG